MGDAIILSITKEASREGVERAGSLVVPPQAPGEPMPQLTPPPPEKLETEWPPAAVTPVIAPPAIAVADEQPEIMAAHQEALRIADELCKTAAQKVAEAEIKTQDYTKGLKKVAALRKELEAYQVPDPTVDEIERLDRLIEESNRTIGRHQQLLISVARYKDGLRGIV